MCCQTPPQVEQGLLPTFSLIFTVNSGDRYRFVLPHLQNWFPTLNTMEVVSVVKTEDRSTFKRNIPAVYIVHLHWLLQKAYPIKGAGPKAQSHAGWFVHVLDAFAEEMKQAEDFSDWRSKVLTPVLVREFYSVDHFNPKAIGEKARWNILYPANKLRLEHWEDFYFRKDVVDPSHVNWWLNIKTIPIEEEKVGKVGKDDVEPDVITSTGSWLL